ncbi:MAG: class I adenylate-forming enzyme family protein, partial [Candidatus Kariarchaeaceae archaeon]
MTTLHSSILSAPFQRSDSMEARRIPEFEFIFQYIDHWAATDPDMVLIRFGDRNITAAQLKQEAEQLAQALLDLGLQQGDRILTIVPPLPEYCTLLVAANMLGLLVVPMDVRYQPTDFQRLLPKIEPALVISIVEDTRVSFADMIAQLQQNGILQADVPVVFLEGEQTYIDLISKQYNRQNELLERKAIQSKFNDLLVIWTGGTTGFPKAAVLTNHNFVRMCIVEYEVLSQALALRGISGRFTYLANLPVSHVGGSVELLGVGMIGGLDMIIHERWSSTRTLQTIQDASLPIMLAAPTMYRIMMTHSEFDSFDLSSLRVTLISGEVVNQEFMDLMHAKICDTVINGYGSTEMGPEVTFTHPDDDPSKLASGYVGTALPGVKLRIADMEGQELPQGETGEVLVQGDLVCNGYFRSPDEDTASFIDGWFKTGDLGRLDENGGLWLQGRIKDIIRVGAYTVLPMEIEELVLDRFELELAAAISVPDPILSEVVWLVVTPKPGEEVTAAEIET